MNNNARFEWYTGFCHGKYKKVLISTSENPRLLGLGTSHYAYTKYYIITSSQFFASNMADDLVETSEQEMQEYFDAAVDIARQAGKVLK